MLAQIAPGRIFKSELSPTHNFSLYLRNAKGNKKKGLSNN